MYNNPVFLKLYLKEKCDLFKPVACKNMKKLPTSLFNCYLRKQPKNDPYYIKICQTFLAVFIQYPPTITYGSICTQHTNKWSLIKMLKPARLTKLTNNDFQ